MPEVICNTSPIQYLHQVGLLSLLPDLAGRVIVPPAVVGELTAGRALQLDLPDPSSLKWIEVRPPTTTAAVPPTMELGPGETEVLALALETPDAVAILDDAAARRIARTLGIRFTGTLGILLDAKRAGRLKAIAPILDRLRERGFRVAPRTRVAVLRLAGESL